MNNIAEIRQNIDDFDKFKEGIKKFFDKVDIESQEVLTINNWFSFLNKYGYKASCGFGKGKLSRYPFIVFIRTDSTYPSASKGVYCRINIERGTDNVNIEIDESKNNKITYKAKQDCEQYNKKKLCIFKRNDLDDIVEQVLKDMEWFAKLPLDSIKESANTQQGSEMQQHNKNTNQNKGKNMANPPLNQILYGPSGTGKTYSTIDKALNILRHCKVIDEIPESREDKRAIFDKYRANKQIEFVTFHQSFSYEEFVEGIKPNIENENVDMTYEVKDGIFKQICIQVRQNLKEFVENQQSEIGGREQHNDDLEKNKTLWRLYTLPAGKVENDYLDECIEQNCVKVWGDYDKYKLGQADNGDYIVIPSANYGEMSKTIRAFGILGGEKKTDEQGEYCKEVEWLWIAESKDKILRFNEANFNRATFQRVKQGKEAIIDYMNILLNKDNANFETKPYILIIDEINRGNISKILGELITLIEPSKRISASDEEKARGIGNESLEVTLPYSNETFGVPSNLYIIGTMNTADRSIALLDTALRRRFEFVEMMPEWNNEHISTDCEGVNLQKLLKSMNERIEFLLDREHTIGHSFFIGVDSLDRLRKVFKLKIIPLLQEYFYDDYAKIDAVLNGNEMIKAKPKPEFLSKFSDEVNDEKVVYEIEKEWQKWKLWQFVKIYNSKATKPQSQDFGESSENE